MVRNNSGRDNTKRHHRPSDTTLKENLSQNINFFATTSSRKTFSRLASLCRARRSSFNKLIKENEQLLNVFARL